MSACSSYHDRYTLRVKTMAEKNGKPEFDQPKVSSVVVVHHLLNIQTYIQVECCFNKVIIQHTQHILKFHD